MRGNTFLGEKREATVPMGVWYGVCYCIAISFLQKCNVCYVMLCCIYSFWWITQHHRSAVYFTSNQSYMSLCLPINIQYPVCLILIEKIHSLQACSCNCRSSRIISDDILKKKYSKREGKKKLIRQLTAQLPIPILLSIQT